MKQYQLSLFGESPLLMHRDNLSFGEKLEQWRKRPENKAVSKAGDDRTPPWTWLGYLYHDGRRIGIDADNVMTMLREGGAKVSTGKGKETFKKGTQSGIMLDQQQLVLTIGGKEIAYKGLESLIGNADFAEHIDAVEALGFELLVKRATIGKSKHVRVRPMFRTWEARGTFTVIDEQQSGLTKEVLTTILRQAGALVGLCDWRPSSPASGTFGRFTSEITLM